MKRKFTDAFDDLSSAYNEELKFQYNNNGVKYKKYDPERNKKTNLSQSFWYENDEANPHLKDDY